jgi:hypothetical protein
LAVASGSAHADESKAADAARAGYEAAGEAADSEKQESEGPEEIARVPLPIYIPPPRGAAAGTVGGSTRGIARVFLLAPYYGHTISAQPVVYWRLEGATAGTVRITIARNLDEPLLDVVVAESAAPGIHAVALADHGISLDLDETYAVSVSHQAHTGALRIADARVTRVEPSAGLQKALASSDHAYLAYAQGGIWYDALQDLSAKLEQKPGDAGLRAAREHLLEQIGQR